MHIKVDDVVQVIAGDDAGERGRVISVDHQAGRLVVEGVNRVYKHVRRSQRNPQGGRLSKEMPIQASNVMLICSRCNAPRRVEVRYGKQKSKNREGTDGSKNRYCKKCHADLGPIAPPRKSLERGRADRTPPGKTTE